MRVWPGSSISARGHLGRVAGRTSLSSPNTPPKSNCGLFDSADSRQESPSESSCPNRPIRSGTARSRTSCPGSSTATAFTGHTTPAHPATRFNPSKGVLDPYAKAIGRDVRWDDSLFGYKIGKTISSLDERDNAAFAPLAIVVDPAYTWGDDRPPRTPWHKTLIYEAHVRGFTMRHPGVPEGLRGTYAGFRLRSGHSAPH